MEFRCTSAISKSIYRANNFIEIDRNLADNLTYYTDIRPLIAQAINTFSEERIL